MRGLRKYNAHVTWKEYSNPRLEIMQSLRGQFYMVEDVDSILEPSRLYIVVEILPGKRMENIGLFDSAAAASKFMNDVIKSLSPVAVTEYGIEEVCIGEVADRYKHLLSSEVDNE